MCHLGFIKLSCGYGMPTGYIDRATEIEIF